MQACIDQMLIWEIEGILLDFVIKQLDNYANRCEFTFGQEILL